MNTKRAHQAAVIPVPLTPQQALWLELMQFYIREASCSTSASLRIGSTSWSSTIDLRAKHRNIMRSILRVEMLVDSKKTLITDKRFDSDESNARFANHVFVRLVAMGANIYKGRFQIYIF